MHDVERHGVGRPLEGGVDLGGIAEAVEARPVAGRALPDLRRAGLQGILDLADRRQRIVLDLDQLGGVLRLGAAFGDHGRHRLADIAHGLVRQRTARRHLGRAAVGIGEHRRKGEVTDSLLGHVVPGEDGDHARSLARSRRVDPDDPGMGMRRAHQHEVRLVGPGQVVGEAAGAGQKPIVLDTLDVLGLAEHRHTLLLSSLPDAGSGGTIAARPRPTRQRGGRSRRRVSAVGTVHFRTSPRLDWAACGWRLGRLSGGGGHGGRFCLVGLGRDKPQHCSGTSSAFLMTDFLYTAKDELFRAHRSG